MLQRLELHPCAGRSRVRVRLEYVMLLLTQVVVQSFPRLLGIVGALEHQIALFLFLHFQLRVLKTLQSYKYVVVRR